MYIYPMNAYFYKIQIYTSTLKKKGKKLLNALSLSNDKPLVQHIKVTMSLVDKSLDSLVVWRGWNPLIAFHFLLHSRFFHVFLMFCIDWTSTYTQIHARIHIQCKSIFGHRKKERKKNSNHKTENNRTTASQVKRDFTLIKTLLFRLFHQQQQQQ